jgi:hypothetical protein
MAVTVEADDALITVNPGLFVTQFPFALTTTSQVPAAALLRGKSQVMSVEEMLGLTILILVCPALYSHTFVPVTKPLPEISTLLIIPLLMPLEGLIPVIDKAETNVKFT